MSQLPDRVAFYCADQNTHRDRSRGITNYTYGLLSHLRDSKSAELRAVVSKSSFKIPDDIERLTLPFRTDCLAGRLLADHAHPLMAPRNFAEIWHYPKGFLPVGLQVRGKKVGTVADVIVQFEADHYPESRPRLAFAYWLAVLKHSIQTFDLIVTISEFSKRDILTFCERHRLKSPPIVVTYQGVNVMKKAAASQKGNYAVHLASTLPHKGTTWLLQQWLSLTETKYDLPILKLVGDLDTEGQAAFSKIKNVELIPPLPRPELEELISSARALLVPSEIEGFGLPAIEGYLLGTPVVFAKGTALEEILGKDSLGAFEREQDSFHRALTEVLNMDRLAIEGKATALRRRHNWEDCVHRTLEAYRAVI